MSLADTQGHDLEQRLSKLSWQVNYLAQKNQIFGLIIDNQTLTQSSGESHRIACQKALALYRPSVNLQSDNHLGGQNAG